MRETTQFGRNVHTTPATAPSACVCVSVRAMQSEKKNSNSGKCSYKLGKGKTGSFSPPFSGTGATKINIDGATTKHALGQVNKNPAARLSSIRFCSVL